MTNNTTSNIRSPKYRTCKAYTYTFADGTEIWQVGPLTGRYRTAEVREHGSILNVKTEMAQINVGY